MIEILMPKLGMIMTEGQVTRWLKQPGEAVRRGELILEVTTEKINYEVEAGGDGSLHPVVPEGETVPVGAVVGFLLAAGEVPPAVIPPPRPVELTATDAPAAPRAAAPSPAGVGGPPLPPGEVRASPAARRLARELGVDLAGVAGTGPSGRIVEADVRVAAARPAAPAEIRASPLARRLAQERGVDLARLTGTGPGGRITEQDVLAAAEGGGGPPSPPRLGGVGDVTAGPGGPPPRPVREIRPLTGMRRIIADRMRQSLQIGAQLTLHTEADVTELVARRQSFLKAAPAGQPRVSYADLIIRAAALALGRHPKINAAIVGNEIHYLEEIAIGFAVALDDGLIVPVVRSADRKSLLEIAGETKALTERARTGKLRPADVTGGTFTVSVLGTIDNFTPIVNPPESAILGVGRIAPKPAVWEGALAIRSLMALSLTIDHRVIDGEPGAQFLRRIRQYLEAPDRLFADSTSRGD